MKRYYHSKIKQVNLPGMGLVWRHRFQEIGIDVPYVGGEIAVDPQTGIPTQKALLIQVNATDHTAYAADGEMVDLPDATLDIRLSTLSNQVKNRVINGLQTKVGFTSAEANAAWNASTTVRDLLNYLGRLNNPAFDALNFDTP